ncbi:MAG: alkane 1-monooxygenase [Solirubrobacteraceae bacterium]
MTIVLIAIFSFSNSGLLAFSAVIFAYGLVSILDLILPAHKYNLTKEEEDYVFNDKKYNYLLYLLPFTLLGITFFYLHTIENNYNSVHWSTLLGWVLSCATVTTALGAIGGHELGHRTSKFEVFLGHICDLCYCSLHRPISHNYGHHKNVSTPIDPVSSNYNEVVYFFWFRAMIGVFIDAWRIEKRRLIASKQPIYSLQNEVIRLTIIQLLFIALIGVIFSPLAMLFFIISSFVTNCLHETVCYIEHYGLKRKLLNNGRYEQVMPHHSWNSEQIASRLLLFELPRHSDHHYRASKKYQTLNHYPDVPTMPFGYAFMIALAMMPPLWFMVMNKKVEAIRLKYGPSLTETL